jgi:hypothetical protein
MRLIRFAAFLLGAVWMAWCAAGADRAWAGRAGGSLPALRARFAAHDSFDRIVLTLPPDASYLPSQSGSVLHLHLSRVGQVSGSVAGRRALAFSGGMGEATITLALGAVARVWQLDDRLIIDVSGGGVQQPASPPLAAAGKRPGRAKTQAAARPAPGVAAAPAPASPAPADLAAPAPALGAGSRAAVRLMPVAPDIMRVMRGAFSPAPVPPQPLRQQAVLQTPSAPGLPGAASNDTASPLPAPSAPPAPAESVAVTLLQGDVPAIVVPLPRDAGAAAFRRGGDLHVVFDVRRALDLGALKDDPVFGGLTERLLPDGMHLRLPASGNTELRLTRVSAGWEISMPPAPDKLSPIAGRAKEGVLLLPAASPGRVVVVEDEATGLRLLVGTQRVQGQRVVAPHQAAEFTLYSTLQGVLLAPLSDRVRLQPVPAGFEVKTAEPPELALAWPDAASGHVSDGRAMTRRFDFVDLPPPILRRRLSQAMLDAAATPLLGRFGARMRVAREMLAEGLDVEAQAVVQVAVADDPLHRNDPDVCALAAIAAWMSAKAGGEAAPALMFDPAGLGNSDEALLWRALWQGDQADAAPAAATLASVWPLLLDMPQGLRRLMLPEAAAILARGGQKQALDALLASFADPSLDLVRAEEKRREGKIEESLALLDQVVARPDRLARSRALEAAVELRLATHRIDVEAAADQLGRQFYTWRDPARELRLRLRVAQLRAQSGAWRPALALLRETDAAFPEAHARVHDAQTAVIADLLRGDHAARLSALDLVALAEEASPLLSAADADSTLAPLLIDRLMALDLPERAEPILRRLFDRSAQPQARAALGLRLARLMADDGDAAGGLKVLGGSDDAGLAPELAVPRTLLRARLMAATGQGADAAASLSAVPGQEAMDVRAGILEQRQDWAGAASAVEGFLAGPAFAALPDADQRALILRAARDESGAGDIAGLRRLRAAYGARFAAGSGADLFAVLTAEPVSAVSDLPRAGQELATVRALPAVLRGH